MYDELFEGVMVATASTSPTVSWEFAVSLLGLRYPAQVFRHMKCARQGLYWGLNELISLFLGSSCLYLLLLDDCTAVHPDTIERLMSWERSLVSALSVQHSPPHSPVAYQEDPRGRRFFPIPQGWLGNIREWVIKHQLILTTYGAPVVLNPRPKDALVEVLSGGAQCLLIDREVFQKISGPWFETGETFYEKVRGAGFSCYVDRSCVASPVRSGTAGLLDFAVWDPIVKYEEDTEDGEEN